MDLNLSVCRKDFNWEVCSEKKSSFPILGESPSYWVEKNLNKEVFILWLLLCRASCAEVPPGLNCH